MYEKIIKGITGVSIVAFMLGVSVIDSAIVPGILMIAASAMWILYVSRCWVI